MVQVQWRRHDLRTGWACSRAQSRMVGPQTIWVNCYNITLYKGLCRSSEPQQRQSNPMGTTPKFGWNRGGVAVLCRKPAISLKRDKIGPMLLLMTNRKSRAFDWCQNQEPWVSLNGHYALLSAIRLHIYCRVCLHRLHTWPAEMCGSGLWSTEYLESAKKNCGSFVDTALSEP